MSTTENDTVVFPQEVIDFFAHLGIVLHDELSEESQEDVNLILEHAGVKGMKWGVRKSESNSSNNSDSGDNKPKGSGGVPKPDKDKPSIMISDDGSISIAGGSGEELDELWDEISGILADGSLSPSEKESKIDALQAKTADDLSSKYNVTKVKDPKKQNPFNKLFGDVNKNVNKTVDDAIKGVKSAIGNTITTTTVDRKTEKTQAKGAKGETGVRRVTSETTTKKNLWGEVIDVKKKTIEHDDLSVDAFIAHVMEYPEEFNDEDVSIVADTLEHYGVKGMKWGVRRRATSAGTSGPSNAKPASSQAKRPVRKPAKTMTNEELNTVINRLRLESQYNQMTATKGDQARQFIKDTLLSAGKSTVQTYANQYLNAAVGTVLNKAGVPSAASITQAAQKAAEEARKAAQAAT